MMTLANCSSCGLISTKHLFASFCFGIPFDLCCLGDLDLSFELPDADFDLLEFFFDVFFLDDFPEMPLSFRVDVLPGEPSSSESHTNGFADL